MSKCRRCNRPLKREPWRTMGIGKICSQKEHSETKQRDGDSDIIVPYDGEDIFIERIASLTLSRNGQLELMKHSCSGIRTNVRRTEYRHSPTGFNFGYGGSGPADFALNILLMFTDKETANNCYQDFKWEHLGAETDRLVIPKQTILDFIAEHKIVEPAQ